MTASRKCDSSNSSAAVCEEGIDGAEPLGGEEFASLMARLGPFEPAPRIAVAVSGGCDSLALALLAHDWAGALGGEAIALTVDHRLRRESAEEAKRVGTWLAKPGVPHHILPWAGPKPRSGIQAAAREARFERLFDWCRDHGVLHLLLAHHLEDQAETFLLRLSRGSGVDGLAAMAPLVEVPCLRLLRPFLMVRKARLAATLKARGQVWIEDPSNRDSAHARVRLRAAMPVLAREGLDVARLSSTAERMARARAALEDATAGLLARAACVFEEGYARFDASWLVGAPEEVSLRALSRILMCVGGKTYPPRFDRLQRLFHDLQKDGLVTARTLHGCRLVPQAANGARERRGQVLVCREAAAAAQRIPLSPGSRVVWDNRFVVECAEVRWQAKPLAERRGKRRRRAILARLGRKGWNQIVEAAPELRRHPVPYPARVGLPALWDDGNVVAVPHLDYNCKSLKSPAIGIRRIAFRPAIPLAGAGFWSCMSVNSHYLLF